MEYRVFNFINGSKIEPQGVEVINIESPQSGKVIATMNYSNLDDLKRAILSTKNSQKKWAECTFKERSQIFYNYRQLLQSNLHELSELCSIENGKTIKESEAEVYKAIELCELATSIPQVLNDRVQQVSKGIECREHKLPLGLTASIVPFNFPIMVPHWTILLSLVLGNTMILKPSEKVPLCSIKIAELLKRSGLPDGVFNVIQGGREIVENICDSADIKALSFVGSTKVAKKVYERSAKTGKRCIALGGAKNNLILLPDADMEMAANDIVSSFTGCAGQRCMAASLLIAVGNVDHIIHRVVEKSANIVAGESMGAVISNESKERIENYISQAVQAGCQLLLDGRHRKAHQQDGYFINPTIISDAHKDQPWVLEEIFGPVLTILRVKSIDEAIHIQNNSQYGNGASVYTQSGEAANLVLSQLTAGMCGVNIGVPVPREPFGFGGFKASKYGVTDITGTQAIDFWTQTKKITTKWNAKYKKDWMS